MFVYENRPSKMIFVFWYEGILFKNFDFENGCIKEFQDNSDQSWLIQKKDAHKKSILELFGVTSPIRQLGS